MSRRRPKLPSSPVERPTPVVPEDDVPRVCPSCLGECTTVEHDADRELVRPCEWCGGAGTVTAARDVEWCLAHPDR